MKAAKGYLIPLTDAELTAIFNAIEDAPEREHDEEEALQRVIHKITPARVGDPKPEGAL